MQALKKFLPCFAVFLFSGPAAAVLSHCKTALLSEPERVQALFDERYERIKNEGAAADIDSSELTIFPAEKYEHSSVSLTPGLLEGEKVLLKPMGKNNTADRNHRGKRELAVQLVLRELNFPVLFKGVFQDENENVFMVSRFQEGELLLLSRAHEWGWKNSCRSITNRTYQDLSALKGLFLRYHIMPHDMQVIVSPKTGAVYMIDVEHYEFFGGRAREKISLAEFRKVDTNQMREHARRIKESFGEALGPEQANSMEKTIKILETRRRTRRGFIRSDWSKELSLPGTFRQKAKFFCASPWAALHLFYTGLI